MKNNNTNGFETAIEIVKQHRDGLVSQLAATERARGDQHMTTDDRKEQKSRSPASGLLADLERRCDVAWDELIAAMSKADREKQAIEATVKEANHKWSEAYAELKAAKSANDKDHP